MHSIYMIENKVNGKKYVGKTSNPTVRRLGYFTKSHNQHLRRAIKKYGAESFEFMILQCNLDDTSVDEAEKTHIKEHKSFTEGYNMTSGGNTLLDPMVAKKHSEATSKQSKKRKPFTTEHEQKLAKILSDNNGSKANSKPVQVESQAFCSINEAIRQTGISQSTIISRIKNEIPGYKYLHKMEN